MTMTKLKNRLLTMQGQMERLAYDPYLNREENADYAASKLLANAREWAAKLEEILQELDEGK